MSRTINHSLHPVACALRSLAALLVFAVGACAPRGIPVPINTSIVASPAASTIPPAQAAEIRFALIGDVTDANAWALFDSKGYTYNDYAIRSGYWPKLYGLSIPGGRFEPRAASALPSPVQAEGALFTASVALRSDLIWTDGTPFTADDVAFTVNTALSFQLGFDWHSYYDPDWLDHAEALDAHTVKFYFKQAPNAGVWQYGALQGPVVQKKYWSPKIADASALLPPADSQSQMAVLQDRVDQLQKQVQVIIADGLTATGNEAHQLQGTLLRKQGDLDQARNNLSKAETSVDASLDAARQALYALDAANEPTLGEWMPAASLNGTRINSANPSHPFGMPDFARATYASFADQASALVALERGEVDGILALNGLQADLVSQPAPGENIVLNRSSSAHFIVINPSRPGLADPILRRALFCAIDRSSFTPTLGMLPLASFTPPGDDVWADPNAVICGEGYDPLTSFDPSKAAAILKSAGYTWKTEPSSRQAGAGLTQPDGTKVPTMSLLGPSEEFDPQAEQAGKVVEASAALPWDPIDLPAGGPCRHPLCSVQLQEL